MEITGKVKVVNAEQQISPTFKKRELVVSTDEQYPQHIMIEFTQDKVDLLNSVKVGDDVKVSINIKGREWLSPAGETKFFNSIHGWRIEKVGAESHAQTPPPMPAAGTFEPAPSFTEEEHDDLPF